MPWLPLTWTELIEAASTHPCLGLSSHQANTPLNGRWGHKLGLRCLLLDVSNSFPWELGRASPFLNVSFPLLGRQKY